MIRPHFRMIAVSIFYVVIFAVFNVHAAGNDDIWSRIDASNLRQSAVERVRAPNRFVAFNLNKSRLKQLLALAPEEFSDGSETILSLPMPDGTLNRFSIEHSLVVEPGLLEKFPELAETYRGQGIDDPTATVRFDLMPTGFHAIILTTRGTLFVDPFSTGDSGTYIAYEKTALPSPKEPFVCHVNDTDITSKLRTEQFEMFQQGDEPSVPAVINGTTLRTYRLALAATGEYTAFTGGTVATALAAQVVSMNRVNGVYERDLAIHMNIVANNNLIVYTDAATDPYTNTNGSTMLGQNTTNLNSVIGTANYDIGHVFSTGGGGVAVLNGPCGSNKARGVTGSSAPVGDGFDIDYIAHEMGHQFGAPHTFNGTTSNCGGGNRTGTSALEPGSGITIMGYAGICGAEDLARHSIDTMAVKSLEQIIAFREAGGICGVSTSTGNTPPSVTGPGNFTIPSQTPFSLTASATDINGDALTYDWQEYDFGALAPPNTDTDGQARPIFRSYDPTAGGKRYFPSLTYILNTANIPPATYDCLRTTPCLTGESLSTMTRTMNFQVVVRDNRSSGGGVNTATSQITVSSFSGPFAVTAPNTAVNYTGGSSQIVTWSVAGSNLSPVNASNVDILLSTDGGLTFPTVLAAATPNDGTQSVTIPNTSTSAARIMVRGTGNVFFDVSDSNFNITSSTVTVSGRVLTQSGRGVRNALVSLTPQSGSPRTVMTNSFGMFSFVNVASGQTYNVSATMRRFTFTPQNLQINNNISNLDFTANP